MLQLITNLNRIKLLRKNPKRIMGSKISTKTNKESSREKIAHARVIEISSMRSWDKQWQAHIDKMVLIDFYAEWCGPCQFMGPAFDALAAKNPDIVCFKIDVDELGELTEKWNVKAMPTFVMVNKGKEIRRVVGAKKDELETMMKEHLKT